MRKTVVRFFQGLIKIYAYLVSPLFGRSCRYHPSCSAYAHEALEKHGLAKGFFLTLRRLLSCHPYSKKNYQDPVPKQFAWRSIMRYKRQGNIDDLRQIDDAAPNNENT